MKYFLKILSTGHIFPVTPLHPNGPLASVMWTVFDILASLSLSLSRTLSGSDIAKES